MDLVAFFADRDSSEESRGSSHPSGDSDASDGDHWLRPTAHASLPATDTATRPVKLTSLQKKEARRQRAKDAAAKKPAPGPKLDLRGKRQAQTAPKQSVPKPAASVQSSTLSSVAGGLPGPLLFLRQRSLSSSNLAVPGGLKAAGKAKLFAAVCSRVPIASRFVSLFLSNRFA